MDLETLKLCRDCAHHDENDCCERTQVIDFVNGEHRRSSCSNERIWDTATGCGPFAKFFEPKVTA